MFTIAYKWRWQFLPKHWDTVRVNTYLLVVALLGPKVLGLFSSKSS
jgi:hypothetical protein